ncbi:hypothetical protein FRB94_010863 [Tulasnella sp. JGI-2019a]|nr:hypothetical protein FRB93_009682 [Tulasnella sp. JGI-2019a]KAG8993293.1 hypothetical protein FRB94_010863 [Tulasnella sp. JGI-2019a]KAG9032069.1 hypothetical protein FRB95_001930 [Tulasnella sp. JGI-2019a]
MSTLPPLSSVLQDKDDLNTALSILFEPSPILTDTLVPQLYTQLQSATPRPSTYADVIDLAMKQIHEWQPLPKAAFIEGHPRIGEVKGLSALSNKEQASPTAPTTLARLAHLNEMYERRYTGLRFVIFVNGRTRAEIVPIMESKLGIGPAEEGQELEPSTDTVLPLDASDEAWEHELERAVHDVGLIAKARLNALGV